MLALAMTSGFIVPSSTSVEIAFSYFNKVLSEDRQKLAPEALKVTVSVCQRRKNSKFLCLIQFFRVIYRVIRPHSSLYRFE